MSLIVKSDDNFWQNVNPVDNSCKQNGGERLSIRLWDPAEGNFSSARVLVAQHSAFVGEATFRGRLCDLGGYAGQDGATTQFNSSLIESWGSKTKQTHAQSGFQPNQN